MLPTRVPTAATVTRNTLWQQPTVYKYVLHVLTWQYETCRTYRSGPARDLPSYMHTRQHLTSHIRTCLCKATIAGITRDVDGKSAERQLRHKSSCAHSNNFDLRAKQLYYCQHASGHAHARTHKSWLGAASGLGARAYGLSLVSPKAGPLRGTCVSRGRARACLLCSTPYHQKLKRGGRRFLDLSRVLI